MAFLQAGCQWDPQHSNPLDPENYRYQPVGRVEITITALDTHLPIPNADVRIPSLDAFSLTDTLGVASFESLPVDTYWVTAERGGDFPYRLDSLRMIVKERQTVRDALALEALPSAFGSVRLRVLTLGQQPIRDATVLISEIGRFVLSDTEGYAVFENLPPGQMLLRAFRETQGEAIYGRDSVEVTVVSATQTESFINLDALPSFTRATANSLAFGETNESEPVYSVQLKAEVFDPDGAFDLSRVEVQWVDIFHEDTLIVNLRYRLDSAFWAATVPSDSFYNRTIENAPPFPFRFQAFDESGNASPLTSVTMVRVVRGFPSTDPDVPPVQFPTLRWSYNEYLDLKDPTLYYYIVRVFKLSLEEELVYYREVPPENFPGNSHTIDTDLPPGSYRWEVWVRDVFGNSSRSPRISFNR